MKFAVNRQEFLSAAKRAYAAVPAASPLEILKCILLETDAGQKTLTLSATNREISLQQTLSVTDYEGESAGLAVDAHLLVAMLTQLCGDTVWLTQESPALLVLTGGEALYRVPVLCGKDFPHTVFPAPNSTVQVSGIPAMVRRTAFATVDNEMTPLLKCVHVRFTSEGLKAVGSDGVCAISAQGDKQSAGDASLLIPATALEKLARMCTDKDTFSVGISEHSVVFHKDNFTYSARLMSGSYINTDSIFDNLKNSFTVLSDAMELRAALESVASLSTDNRVKLAFDGGTLRMSCSGDMGSSAAAVSVIPLSGCPAGEYFFTANRLERSLRAMGGTVTLGIAQGGMLTISCEDAQYMQTPTRAPVVKKAHVKPKAKAA